MGEPQFDIICPASKQPISEYVFGIDISATVDAHMRVFHPDWQKVRYLDYIKIGAASCPICHNPCESSLGVDRHVRMVHKFYRKVDELEYRFDEVAYEEARLKAASGKGSQ